MADLLVVIAFQTVLKQSGGASDFSRRGYMLTRTSCCYLLFDTLGMSFLDANAHLRQGEYPTPPSPTKESLLVFQVV